MRHFPVFLNLADQSVVIVGGGEQAAQKARLLLRTEAELIFMAPQLCEELAAMVDCGKARHVPTVLNAEALIDARLVIVATGCAAADCAAADLARQAGAVVNVVDRPALSDATMPAIVDRDPVVVAIGTEGTAPVLARQIKTRVEAMLEPELGRFARLAGALRARVAQHIEPGKRRAFWEWAMGTPRRLMSDGHDRGARSMLDKAIASGEAPAKRSGALSVVDIGTGEPDLLTLRAVERLQSADLIIHISSCPTAVLDLARRDAQRRIPRDLEGPSQWRIDRELRQAVTDAESGMNVVWLGASTHVVPVLQARGLDHELIPSVAGQTSSPIIARAEHA